MFKGRGLKQLQTLIMRYSHTLNLKTMNPGIAEMEYCVKDEIDIRANELEKELLAGIARKPFNSIINANFANPHQNLQKPISYFRQIMACLLYPELLKDSVFPQDVKDRANELLDTFSNRSLGCYTPSNGNMYIRKTIAKHFKRRDNGVPSNPEDIVITMGATDAIGKILELIAQKKDTKPTGVMIPIPSYPLYNAHIVMNGMHCIGYYLDEENDWEVNILDLKRALMTNIAKCHPRAIIMINPNNPTGHLMTEKNIKEVIQFAYQENLLVIADEVYQTCIYDIKKGFHSFKKCLMNMGEPYNKRELISIASLSKGVVAESGLRGGCMEVVNFNSEIKANFYKMMTALSCPPTTSQSILAMSLKPPTSDQPSYQKYHDERITILNNCRERAEDYYKDFNSFPGMSCNRLQGSMFIFPKIKIPPNVMERAKEQMIYPDVLYCRNLLEETGICIVPGSKFGQRPNTWHVRVAILSSKELYDDMISRWKPFHEKWMKQ